MADRRVRRSGKDGQGDITALCGDWGRVSKAVAIAEINARANRYYVQEVTPAVDVTVVNGANGPYLRSTADRTSKNNLDNLPDC